MSILQSFTRIVVAASAATVLLFGCGTSDQSRSATTDAASGYGDYGKTSYSTVVTPTAVSQIMIEGSNFSVVGDAQSSDVLSVMNHDGFTHTVTP